MSQYAPFHEPHHEPQTALPRNRDDVRNRIQRARLIGLNREAQALPMPVPGRAFRQRFEHVERKLETLAFFGIDREIDAGTRRALAQHPCARHEFAQHARALRVFVTRIERRELDRNAVALFRCLCGIAVPRERIDRVPIVVEIEQRVRIRARAFAEHVIAETERRMARSPLGRARHRDRQCLAEHELTAQQLHRAQRDRDHCLAAEPAQEAGSRAVGGGQHCLRQRKRASGQRAEPVVVMRVECSVAELVGSQRDRGLAIGHAQQRFGEPHERVALGA